MEGSRVWLARVDASLATVMRCVTEQEAGDGQQPNLYGYRQGNNLDIEIGQLTGNLQIFVQCWAGMRWCPELVNR